MAADYTHYEGDHFGPIEAELYEDSGARVTFAEGETVHMELYRLGREEAVFDVEAEIVGSEEEGQTVKVELDAADEDAQKVTKGTYRFIWRVESDGEPTRYPRPRELWHTLICEKAGTVPEPEA